MNSRSSLVGLAVASILLAAISHAQQPAASTSSHVVIIGYNPAQPGIYRVQITVNQDGTATTAPLAVDYTLGSPTDPPEPPIDPETSKGIAAKLTKEALLKEGSTATTARGLSIVYERVAKAFSDGDLDGTKAAQALRDGSAGIVALSGDPKANWAPMLAGLDSHITELRQQGKFSPTTCADIQAGIDSSMRGMGIFDNIDLAKLIEFIMFIIKLIMSLG